MCCIVQGSLEDSMSVYGNDTEIKSAIDRLQMELKCCGSSTYKDWWTTEWYSVEYIDLNSDEVGFTSTVNFLICPIRSEHRATQNALCSCSECLVGCIV